MARTASRRESPGLVLSSVSVDLELDQAVGMSIPHQYGWPWEVPTSTDRAWLLHGSPCWIGIIGCHHDPQGLEDLAESRAAVKDHEEPGGGDDGPWGVM
jgi:hypothetical protein